MKVGCKGVFITRTCLHDVNMLNGIRARNTKIQNTCIDHHSTQNNDTKYLKMYEIFIIILTNFDRFSWNGIYAYFSVSWFMFRS